MKKRIAILGSTGSIGTQSLDVCRMQGYEVNALTAHQNAELLEQQVREFHPKYAVLTDPEAAARLKDALRDTSTQVLCGEEGVLTAAADREQDTVLNALMGVAGLRPTVEALQAGHNLALANKETLVAGGKLVTSLVREKGVQMTPIDSEHSAIFQCLQGNDPRQLSKILLTASGGPFFGKSREELSGITPAQALRHPNWTMGAKITIDSATLMNKGLEFIEAMWLFGVRPEQIQVVVHRQSIIHSMVEYEDGSVMAQLGAPDMRIPIQYALTWPERLPSPAQKLDLFSCGDLSFARPDLDTFTCLRDAIRAIELGGLYPSVVNGANEEAVAAFLGGKIGFLDLFDAVSGALEWAQGQDGMQDYDTVDQVLAADRQARAWVRERFALD